MKKIAFTKTALNYGSVNKLGEEYMKLAEKAGMNLGDRYQNANQFISKLGSKVQDLAKRSLIAILGDVKQAVTDGSKYREDIEMAAHDPLYLATKKEERDTITIEEVLKRDKKVATEVVKSLVVYFLEDPKTRYTQIKEASKTAATPSKLDVLNWMNKWKKDYNRVAKDFGEMTMAEYFTHDTPIIQAALEYGAKYLLGRKWIIEEEAKLIKDLVALVEKNGILKANQIIKKDGLF